jgi:hypothetical protein
VAARLSQARCGCSYAAGIDRMTQRNPMWLMPVSIIWVLAVAIIA